MPGSIAVRPNLQSPISDLQSPWDALRVLTPGLVPYPDALDLQLRLVEERREGGIPDTLLLLEHPPVITRGRAARESNILSNPAALAARGIQVYEVGRGGDVTYHAPGQLVGYAIMDLDARGRDVHAFLRSMEAALIRALASFDVTARRIDGLTGVWSGNEKVAAIGVGVKRWVTYHGFALNVSTELSGFAHIVPCGLAGRGVTSLSRLLGRQVPMADAQSAVIDGWVAEFGCQLLSS